jgi:hypothetical protein
MGDGTATTPERKFVKLDGDKHHRLKMAAAARRVTMIDLLGEAVDAYLDGERPETRRKRSSRKADALSA